MSPLYAELHRWSGMPHAWGTADCMTVVCDWLVRLGWPDPMADLRLTYDSAASCQRQTGFLRDAVAVADRHFGAAGLRRGNDLRAGDVAVVRVAGAEWPIGALWTGECWAIKGPNGTTTVRPEHVEMLAFWSAGYREPAS